ncbi:MAG: hypothetical protein KJS91_00310 [Planctomycetes bacterium]|nr:hypothetical protein [Planctomycetota bacterium]
MSAVVWTEVGIGDRSNCLQGIRESNGNAVSTLDHSVGKNRPFVWTMGMNFPAVANRQPTPVLSGNGRRPIHFPVPGAPSS